MKLKYHGSLARFQKHVLDCGAFGDWRWLKQDKKYQFHSWTGEILNWWPSTGTVFFQGQPGPLQSRLIAVYVRQIANDDDVYLVSPRALIS